MGIRQMSSGAYDTPSEAADDMTCEGMRPKHREEGYQEQQSTLEAGGVEATRANKDDGGRHLTTSFTQGLVGYRKRSMPSPSSRSQP